MRKFVQFQFVPGSELKLAELYALDEDGRMWLRTRNRDGWWSEWRELNT